MSTFLKNVGVVVFLFVVAFGCGQVKSQTNADSNKSKAIVADSAEQLISKGKLVEVYAEKAVFLSPRSKNFLMKFTIRNISGKTVGVELSNYWSMFYPNQWGFYEKPVREVIDETQIIPNKNPDTLKLQEKFKNNMLTNIKPGESLVFYRDWNGSGEKINPPDKNAYLIVSIDGQLFITDGKSLEHLTLNEAEEAKRVVVIKQPYAQKQVPEDGMLIKNKDW